jgi:hypothetical protein
MSDVFRLQQVLDVVRGPTVMFATCQVDCYIDDKLQQMQMLSVHTLRATCKFIRLVPK